MLSFSHESDVQSDESYIAGDVIVSLETMKKNARHLELSEKDELKRLLVHGILHLSGMDHDEDAEDGGMLDLQEKILRAGE